MPNMSTKIDEAAMKIQKQQEKNLEPVILVRALDEAKKFFKESSYSLLNQCKEFFFNHIVAAQKEGKTTISLMPNIKNHGVKEQLISWAAQAGVTLSPKSDCDGEIWTATWK